MITKNFFLNTSLEISRGEENFSDLGYTVAIPWNDITTAGWYNYNRDDANLPIKMWGTENKLVLDDAPEYWAPDNTLRSTGGIPTFNVNNPIYAFDRSTVTRPVY